jgi:hypothetical protein
MLSHGHIWSDVAEKTKTNKTSQLATTMTNLISPRTPLISIKIYSLTPLCLQQLNSARYYHPQMPTQAYKCNVDAEPLHRYRPGGYHPLALGDALKNERYKILHKLGWGSYSTTWAAKDQKYAYFYNSDQGTLFSNLCKGRPLCCSKDHGIRG